MPRAKDRVRVCQWCNSEFELSNKMGQYKYCSIPCRSAWHANKYKTSERTKRDPLKQKNYLLKTKYGITIDDFQEMKMAQNSKCDTCFTEIDNSAHVDHCHETGKVRSLLCSCCNQALGLLKEDIATMGRMIEYVKRHKC